MEVTVIGTGRMGSALVKRLAKQGFDVYAWNRTRDKLRDLPAKAIDDISQARGGITFIFVSDDEALNAVKGVGGDVIVLSGTYSISAVTALNVRFTGMGKGLLAAPVVGGGLVMLRMVRQYTWWADPRQRIKGLRKYLISWVL